MAAVGIIGAGTWGTALAVLLNNNGQDVTIWSAFDTEIQEMSRTRRHKNLPEVVLPDQIQMTADLRTAMAEKDMLIMAVPSVYVRSTAAKMKEYLRYGQIVVDVAKGIEEQSLMTMSQVIEEELPLAEVAVLSGPSHAEEVSRGLPTTCVAAAHRKKTAEFMQSVFMSPVFRIYTSPDMLGVEIGAALKNVIALAAGALDGLGLGDNTKAALMTRGLTEIARLGVACGARTETFGGLSGMGDLIVTCTSMHSRNRRCGILVGQGLSGAEAVKQVGMTVEGYTNTKNAYEMGRRLGVEMPITNEVYKVLYEGKDIRQAIADLMGRPRRHESEYTWLQEGNLSR